MAIRLARSIRIHSPGIPIAVVANNNSDRYSLLLENFDYVINYNDEYTGWLIKLSLNELSPYEESIFIDADSLVVRNLSFIFDLLKYYSFATVGDNVVFADQFFHDSQRGHYSDGRMMPSFNGGFYWFRKDPIAANVFSSAKNALVDYDLCGLKRLNGKKMDEALFCYAMRKHDLCAFEDSGSIMRTPLRSKGRFELDVYGGISSFIKDGQRVTPAIVHCCGPWLYSRAYLRESTLLERQDFLSNPNVWERTIAEIKSAVFSITRKAMRACRVSVKKMRKIIHAR